MDAAVIPTVLRVEVHISRGSYLVTWETDLVFSTNEFATSVGAILGIEASFTRELTGHHGIHYQFMT